MGLTNNVLTASLNALGNQRAMEWSAYSAAGSLASQEGLAFDDLNSAQQAANKASSAAKTAYLRAKGRCRGAGASGLKGAGKGLEKGLERADRGMKVSGGKGIQPRRIIYLCPLSAFAKQQFTRTVLGRLACSLFLYLTKLHLIHDY